MYSLLSLKTPTLGLRISRIGFRDPGIVVTKVREPHNYHQQGEYFGSGVTPETPRKAIKFQASLQNKKNNEILSKCPKIKLDPGIMRDPISAIQSQFLQYLLCQRLDVTIPDIQIHI